MRTGQAGCGLRYAVKRSGSQVGYCSLSVKCGTRDEEGFHSGIAHFVEHTVFKGTKKKSSAVINSYLDRLGGELNAYTTKEEIVFHATVLKEDIRKASGLLFELATQAQFPEKHIQTEKTVVIDEINSYKDCPADDVYDRFEEMLFAGHPLSGPILGTASSVRKISGAELREFVGARFVPSKMAFTLVCNTTEARMEKLVLDLCDKFFPDAPDVPAAHATAAPATAASETPDAHAATTPSETPSAPVAGDVTENAPATAPAAVPFDRTVSKRNHQVNCVIGNVAPSLYAGKERIAAILLSNILGGPGANSILNASLREKNGWVYSVECTYTQYADTGIVAIYFGCDRENLDKCLDLITREIGKLQREPMTQTKLKAAKKQLLGQLAVSGDNGEAQCLSMGKSLLAYGRVASSGETRAQIDEITPEDIMESARKIFAAERLSKLIFM